jgi:hypothetical protein
MTNLLVIEIIYQCQRYNLKNNNTIQFVEE